MAGAAPSPFLAACGRGDLEACTALESQSPEGLWDKHVFDFDCGAIHYAVCSGNLELVKWLISKGGLRMAESRNRLGWTMLHVSLLKGWDEIARWIVGEVPPNPLHYTAGVVFDVDAFVMAAQASRRLSWILPLIWEGIHDWVIRDAGSLSRIIWSCRECLDDVFSVMGRYNSGLPQNTTLPSWAYLKALRTLHETDVGMDYRGTFALLLRHGLIPRFEGTKSGATSLGGQCFWLCSKLRVLDLLIGHWFGDFVTVKQDPEPCDCTAAAWVTRLKRLVEVGPFSESQRLHESLEHYLSLMSKVLFGGWSEQTELATLLLSAQFHTAPRASLECILERLVFVADHSPSMSFAGLGMFVELKTLLDVPLPYPTCPIWFCPDACHSASLLQQLSRLDPLGPHCPWQLFRIIIANSNRPQTAYLGMGALWTMRVRHKASVTQLLMQTHRGLVMRTPQSSKIHLAHWNSGAALNHCEALWLLSCMDRRTGFMFPKLPLRPHYHIYSMLFCVPGYFE